MSDILQAIRYFFTTVYIITFKFFVFILYPSYSLVRELKGTSDTVYLAFHIC